MVNKSETPITKFKAAVYQKTPAPWLPSKPKFLTIIIIMQTILICVSQEWRDSRLAWLILGILIPVSGWLLMRWRIYSSVFITPSGRSKKTITDQRWKEFYFSGWGEERMKAHYLKSEIESEDTILYLHGYNSSLGNGESRCQHINSLGFNVIGLDQRGFGKQKGRHERNFLWAYSIDTKKLSRILIAPEYAEVSGLHVSENVNNYWYLLASFQKDPDLNFLYFGGSRNEINKRIKNGYINGISGYLSPILIQPPH